MSKHKTLSIYIGPTRRYSLTANKRRDKTYDKDERVDENEEAADSDIVMLDGSERLELRQIFWHCKNPPSSLRCYSPCARTSNSAATSIIDIRPSKIPLTSPCNNDICMQGSNRLSVH